MHDGDANECMPPLTWEQRDGMLFATGKVLTAEIGRGASPVAVRPLFDLLFTLAVYEPAGAPPKPARPRGRPSKPLSVFFPSKAQKRVMAKRKRPADAGKRGPAAGSDHDMLRPAVAKRLHAVVQHMAKYGGREYAAANAVLRDVLPLSELEDGYGKPDRASVARQLARAYQRFGYAAYMPRYRLHHAISEALQRGDIAHATGLVAKLQSLRDRKSV